MNRLRIAKENEHELWCHCCFHKDEHPSMLINKDGEFAGMYHCFQCGRHGKAEDLGITMKVKKTKKKKEKKNWHEVWLKQQDVLINKFGVELNLNGKGFAIVDSVLLATLNRYKWYVYKDHHGKARPFRKTKLFDGKFITLPLHRNLLGLKYGDKRCGDHINGDTLDNRLSNLRICTHTENCQNQDSTTGTSKYKGIRWHKASQKWEARIGKNNETLNIGFFEDEIVAAKAYDKKAIELFGEFARLNFPTNKEWRPKDLAQEWDVSIQTLRNYGLCYNGKTFCWPMVNENYQIIGLQQRFPNSRKVCMKGSRLGIFAPLDLQFGELYICEGLSDTVACAGLGFVAIGRPNAKSCKDMIVKFSRNHVPKVPITIVLDNDMAGESGAINLAQALKLEGYNNIQRRVPEAKDLREFVQLKGKNYVKQWLKG